MQKSDTNLETEPERQGAAHQSASPEEHIGEAQSASRISANRAALPASREELQADRDALLDRLARTQAEFDNARKRAAREQREFKEFALADAVTSLLPVLDSLDLALQTPPQSLEEMRSGVDLIRKQLQDTLSKLGLAQISAKGEPFDPRLHEAIESVDTTAAQDNHVLSELQRGYKLGTRLLRPAMVSVARNPQEEPSRRD